MGTYTALESLMRRLFTADELRQFLSTLPNGEYLVAALPGANATHLAITHEAVLVLARHGLLETSEFWASMALVRPLRRAEIYEVRDQLRRAPPPPPSLPPTPPPRRGLVPTLPVDDQTLAQLPAGGGFISDTLSVSLVDRHDASLELCVDPARERRVLLELVDGEPRRLQILWRENEWVDLREDHQVTAANAGWTLVHAPCSTPIELSQDELVITARSILHGWLIHYERSMDQPVYHFLILVRREA